MMERPNQQGDTVQSLHVNVSQGLEAAITNLNKMKHLQAQRSSRSSLNPFIIFISGAETDVGPKPESRGRWIFVFGNFERRA